MSQSGAPGAAFSTISVARPAHPPSATPRRLLRPRGGADRIYRFLASVSGLTTLVILLLIGVFLLLQALPTFRLMGLRFFTTSVWHDLPSPHPQFGVAAILYWTVIIAVVALAIAVLVSIPGALFITEYAPRRMRRGLTALVDLLAAIPSVIYGIWGLAFLQPHLVAVSRWLNHNLGFVPIFQVDRTEFVGSAFVTGVVVSLMVMPICTSVMREVFAQAPPGEKEAAMALGATRWGMIRTVVLPFGRGGIVGGAMLGLGRALGETIAVALIVSPVYTTSTHWLQSGANSVAATIANLFADASQPYGIPALMAAGLSLFGITLIVNLLASLVVARSRSGRGVEI